MKIRLIVCSLIAIAGCSVAYTQDNKSIPQTEIMLGAGIYPWISDIFAYDGIYDMSRYEYYSKKTTYAPSVNATFAYRFKRWFALSGVLGYSVVTEPYYDIYTDEKHATQTQHRITAMPVARFYWFNSPTVSLYSSLGMGATYSWLRNFQGNTQCNSSEIAFAIHWAPVGIIVGRRLFGYAEWGAGMLGIVHAGIGYRF